MISRRLFLKQSPAAVVAGTALAVPVASEHTAIPTDVHDAICRWRDAHRRHVVAANAYTAAIQARPVDPAVCGSALMATVHAEREVGPAREAMILALLRLDGGGA